MTRSNPCSFPVPPEGLSVAHACNRRHKKRMKREKGEGNVGKYIVKRKIQRERQGKREITGSRNRN